jgi:predicted dehydrogenase
MKIAIVGCGYVFDFYLGKWPGHPDLDIVGIYDIDGARLAQAAAYYNLPVYDDLDAVLGDPQVQMVVNLTSIGSHFAVSKAALKAGKHVYCEKPLVTDMAQAFELAALARDQGLVLSGAPGNLYSDTVLTMWQAVRDGLIGKPVLAYAEFDDMPIYLMAPENWRSASGAPWPYLHEYESGCTWEHAGYHLVWLCAILGPAVSITGFSRQLISDKTDVPLHPADTPDFSVGMIHFASGAVARLTCSIIAPPDHRMRLFGRNAELWSDSYRDYQAPVFCNTFTPRAMSLRRLRVVRNSSFLQWLFAIGGRRLPLVRHARSRKRPRLSSAANFRKRQEGEQDKVLGIALVAEAIREGRPSPIPTDFVLHVTELTLAIQSAGTQAATHRMETRFVPFDPPPSVCGPRSGQDRPPSARLT